MGCPKLVLWFLLLFSYKYHQPNSFYLTLTMDSNTSDFFLNPYYYQAEQNGSIIDLGLSLKTSSPHWEAGYDEIIGWEEEEAVQSRENWGYIKVNMDGVVVGRKIYILNHGDYSSLALQLEDMFGREGNGSGLRLLNPGSDFCLLYKNRVDHWRTVGDVPWKEFVECVKRLRIARRT